MPKDEREPQTQNLTVLSRIPYFRRCTQFHRAGSFFFSSEVMRIQRRCCAHSFTAYVSSDGSGTTQWLLVSSGNVLAGQAWPWLPGRPLLLLVYLRWLLGRSLVSAGQPKVRRTTVEIVDVPRCAINDDSHDPVPIEVDVEPRVSRVGHSLEVYLGYIYPPTDLGITDLESSELGTLLQGASTLRPTLEVEPEGIGVWHSSVGFLTHRPTRAQCHQSSLPAVDAQLISTALGSIAREDPCLTTLRTNRSPRPIGCGRARGRTKAAFNGVEPTNVAW